MRSLITLSVAVLFTLAVLPGTVAGQSKKTKARARVSRRANEAGSHPQASSTQTQATVNAPVPVTTMESQGDGVRRITPAEARAAVEAGKAIIVDVRGEDSYNAGHVKGARWIPLNDIGSRAAELPRDKMIITYCS